MKGSKVTNIEVGYNLMTEMKVITMALYLITTCALLLEYFIISFRLDG